jgi:hypothetical protein
MEGNPEICRGEFQAKKQICHLKTRTVSFGRRNRYAEKKKRLNGIAGVASSAMSSI